MKRWIASILILSMTLLTACSGTAVIAPTDPKQPETVPTEVEATTPATETTAAPTEPAASEPETDTEGAVLTGLAVVPTVGSSKNAGEKNGVAQSDITVVAVLVGADGVILDCVIDSVQAKAEFSAQGTVVGELGAVPTKNELGEGYGMKQYSGIGKEWSEQAEALADYAVGKTVAELKGISLNERGAAAEDTDLAASVTVSIGGYIDAIAQAVENAQALGAAAGDTLKLSVTTKLSGSDVGEKDGKIQAETNVAAISFAGETITSCLIDAVQCTVNFDATGAITTDLTAPILTKNQLGEDYGMKQYSGIGKEWFEQAAGFAAYVTGKTVAEVAGVALTESGTAADADLAASVTINLGAFLELIAKTAE